MTKKQKSIIANFAVVIIITIISVIGILNFKDYVNKSEAIQATKELGAIVIKYRNKNKSVPSENYVTEVIQTLPGQVRLGSLRYRGKWIEFGAEPNTILAFVYKDYNSLAVSSGYIVLELNGTVKWMKPEDFEKVFEKQKNKYEEDLKK